MTELEGQVCRLLFHEGVSSTEAAQRLRMSPAEVVSIAVNSKKQTRRSGKEEAPSVAEDDDLDEEEQIQLLRLQVRRGLLARTRPGVIDEIPASALVRLWQLVEDPRLLGKAEEEEEPFAETVSEETREAIFRLLDGKHEVHYERE